MSATYNIRGQRYLRKYTANNPTPSYASASEAATIASTLCDLKWEKVDNVQPCFFTHASTKDTAKIDEGNVSSRDYYDAALFCANHDTNAGTHIAYANAACYKFTLPDLVSGESARVLESLSVAVNCDPYVGAGARIAVFTNSTGIIPTDCQECRNGSLSTDTDSSKQSHVSGSSVWSSTNTHVEGAAPRTTGNNNTWYSGAGTATITPTGGLTLGKYLYVFVLLENYNVARAGYLEGSAFIQKNVSITLANSVSGWSTTSANDLTGATPLVIFRGRAARRSPSDCSSIVRKAYVSVTPASDLCMPALETVKLAYDGSGERGVFLSGTEVTGLIRTVRSGQFVQSFLPRQILGEAVTGSSQTLVGPPQSVYAWDDEQALISSQTGLNPSAISTAWSAGQSQAVGRLMPLFNSEVLYYPDDYDLPENRQAGYWFASRYLSASTTPKGAGLGSLSDYLLPDVVSTPMKLRYDGSVTASEGQSVSIEHPYAANLNPDRITSGTGPSSVGCVLHPRMATDTIPELPGVDLFVGSVKTGTVFDHPSKVTEHIDYVRSVTVYGSDVIKSTAAYNLLKNGTATGVFLGDCAGPDSSSLNVGVHHDSDGAFYLKSHLLRKDGVFYYDAVAKSTRTNRAFGQWKKLSVAHNEWNESTGVPDEVTSDFGTDQLRLFAGFTSSSVSGTWLSTSTWEFSHPTLTYPSGSYGYSTAVDPDERSAIDTYLEHKYGIDLDEYFASGMDDSQLEAYLGANGTGSSSPCPVWRSYRDQDASISNLDSSLTYPVFVTDGSHTYVGAYLRIVTQTCYDIVRYPDTTVLDEDKVDISKCNVFYAYNAGLSAPTINSNNDFFTGVPLLYLVPYKCTFVQMWAADTDTSSIDFGPASAVVHLSTLQSKEPGSYFNYDVSTGIVTPDTYDYTDFQKFVSFENGSGSGTISVSFMTVTTGDDNVESLTRTAKTISVAGTVDRLVPDPVTDGVVYAFGSFTTVGGVSCTNVAKINVASADPVVSAPSWDSAASMVMLRGGVRDYIVSPASVCASTVALLSSDFLVTGGISSMNGVAKTGRVMKISPSEVSAPVSNVTENMFGNLDTVTPFWIMSGDSIATASVYSCSGSAGGYYTEQVFTDTSYMEDVSGSDALVGMNACYSKIADSSVTPVSLDTYVNGVVFDLTFGSVTIPALVTDVSGNTVKGTVTKPVWKAIMSALCIPFSLPTDATATTLRVSWGNVTMHGYGASAGDVTRHSSVSGDAVVRVWVNTSSRVGDLTSFNPAFFDAKSSVSGWTYLGTIQGLSSLSSADFSLPTMTGRVGTVLLAGWIPPETVDASDVVDGFEAGIGEMDYDFTSVSSVNEWAPDVSLV